MAKQRQRKAAPARKYEEPGDEDSLLIRSAESLGRMIGTLQRQLRVVQLAGDDEHAKPASGRSRSTRTSRSTKKTAAGTRASARTASTASAKSATSAARKPRATKKTKRARNPSR